MFYLVTTSINNSSLLPLLVQELLVILDTLQTTEHFPYVFKLPEHCLMTWGFYNCNRIQGSILHQNEYKGFISVGYFLWDLHPALW